MSSQEAAWPAIRTYRMAVILFASAPQCPGTIWPEQRSIDVKRLLEGSKDVVLGRGFMCFLADGSPTRRIAPSMSRFGIMPPGNRSQASNRRCDDFPGTIILSRGIGYKNEQFRRTQEEGKIIERFRHADDTFARSHDDCRGTPNRLAASKPLFRQFGEAALMGCQCLFDSGELLFGPCPLQIHHLKIECVSRYFSTIKRRLER
jgi:hypothetical protein